MKAEIILFGLIIFFLNSCSNQTKSEYKKPIASMTTFTQKDREQLTFFRTLDKREILGRLFDNPQFDSSGMAIWKGNYSDLTSLSIPLSYDGKFHTSLDTIFYFRDSRNRECAVAIFSTYSFQFINSDSTKPEPSGCHFCGVPIGAALFNQQDNHQWQLYKFQKEFMQLGYGGIYKTGRQDESKIQLKEIGDHWTCLSLTNGPGGNGGFLEGGEFLYSIEEYGLGHTFISPLQLLFVNSYDCSENFWQKNVRPEIKPMKVPGRYYDLLVRTIHNDSVKTKPYMYSPECEKYIEK